MLTQEECLKKSQEHPRGKIFKEHLSVCPYALEVAEIFEIPPSTSLYLHPTFCRTLENDPSHLFQIERVPSDAWTVFFNTHPREATPKASLAT